MILLSAGSLYLNLSRELLHGSICKSLFHHLTNSMRVRLWILTHEHNASRSGYKKYLKCIQISNQWKLRKLCCCLIWWYRERMKSLLGVVELAMAALCRISYLLRGLLIKIWSNQCLQCSFGRNLLLLHLVLTSINQE